MSASGGTRQSSSAGAPSGPATNLPLASLFACEVAVAQAIPALADDGLYPEELEYLANAVPKRRAEFGTARVCARRALAELGFPPSSLAPNPDRSPRWPEGAIGSLSHTAGYCAAVVARSHVASGLGLDVEPDEAIAPELEATLCTPPERSWLDRWPREERGRMTKIVFSAKEAFYKCQYGTTRSFLDFSEVDLAIDVGAGTFAVARIHRPGREWQLAANVQGRILRAAGFIVTAATLL